MVLVCTLIPRVAQSQIINGFDLKDALIPVPEIMRGGPPRDGIPSIDSPIFVSAQESDYPNHQDRVLGVFYNEVAKAYPIGIMNYHEIVNDSFNKKGVVVTYCPLCGSGLAFEAQVAGVNRTFGVSGLLYNSDVLLYDRQSESLWSQMMAQAVTGGMKGMKLELISTANTTWKEWRSRYPKTLVLTTKTGYSRDYNRTPYLGYDQSEALYFPVDKGIANRDRSYHPKERVLGIEIDANYKAYPFSELQKHGGELQDEFMGQQLTILYNNEDQTARALSLDGSEVASYVTFWFAWAAFHQNSEVFSGKGSDTK